MNDCTVDGGVPFLNKCFKEMDVVETIEEARKSCIFEGKSLFLLDSDRESNFMDDLIKYSVAWVGATYDEDDDTILWDDGKLLVISKGGGSNVYKYFHRTNVLLNKNINLLKKIRRVASLVGITERETGVGKLGWHGNSTRFDRKNICFFFLFCVTKEKRKIS